MKIIEDAKSKLHAGKEIFQANINTALVVGAIILGCYSFWSPKKIFLFGLLIYLLIYPRSSSFYAKVAVLLLALVPVLLLISRLDVAEESSILAFIFLIMAVFMLLVEHFFKQPVDKGRKSPRTFSK